MSNGFGEPDMAQQIILAAQLGQTLTPLAGTSGYSVQVSNGYSTPSPVRSFTEVINTAMYGPEQEIMQAGGLDQLIQIALRYGKVVLPLIIKYWPWAAAAVGAALGISQVVSPGTSAVIPGTSIALGGPGAAEPSAAMIVKEWSTGTARFYMLTNGYIACRKRNGQWKAWRPARHIVVPRNPRVATLIRADKRIDRLMRGLARRARRSPTFKSVTVSKKR